MVSYAGTARVVIRFTRTLGDDMLNIIHVARDDGSPMTAVHLLEACTSVNDGWWDNGTANDIKSITSNEVTLADITAVSLDPSNTGLFQQLVVNEAGDDTGFNLPPQIAAVVSHRTAFATRTGRGRTYHGGITSTIAPLQSASYATISAAGLTALQGAWNGLDTELAGLVNPQSHVIASEVLQDTNPVINRVYTAKLFTQRRRN